MIDLTQKKRHQRNLICCTTNNGLAPTRFFVNGVLENRFSPTDQRARLVSLPLGVFIWEIADEHAQIVS